MPYKAIVYGGIGQPHERSALQAMHTGLKRVGYDVTQAPPLYCEVPEKKDADVTVILGYRPIHSAFIAKLNERGIPCLVVELGYLKRQQCNYADGHFEKIFSDKDQYQVSVNDICWLPPGNSCQPDRFLKLNLYRSENRTHGKHVLVCGQTIGDAQHGFETPAMKNWIVNTFETLNKHTERAIVWRAHPKMYKTITGGPFRSPEGADIISNPLTTSLEADLTEAHAVVTVNSTSAQSALLKGIPVFCEPFAIYAEVANLNLNKIEYPDWHDTEDYFNRLAYAQWTLDEMREGLPITFLERFI